ncbi:MAG: hypothetical protein J5757_03985 [Lachnospiraceae bacterium]|nr:hypothetical protein [Lachnospiraceae bacterium]
MKRVLALILVLVMVMAVVACDKGGDSGSGGGGNAASTTKADNGGGGGATQAPGKTEAPAGNGGGSGYISGVIEDKYAPAANSTADKFWKVKEIQEINKFDKDGNCTEKYTIYYLKDPADYNDVNEQIAGTDYIWNSDKASFQRESSMKKYTSIDDAKADIEDAFRGYTIEYSGGKTEHVDAPDDARKTEIMKEVFGFNYDDLKTEYGNYTYSTRQKKKVIVTYINDAKVEDINALAKIAFEVCKPLADEGKIYDYLGKYGNVLTEAPQTESIFNDATFNYFRNGSEISVQAQILNSGDYSNTLALAVYVVK